MKERSTPAAAMPSSPYRPTRGRLDVEAPRQPTGWLPVRVGGQTTILPARLAVMIAGGRTHFPPSFAAWLGGEELTAPDHGREGEP